MQLVLEKQNAVKQCNKTLTNVHRQTTDYNQNDHFWEAANETTERFSGKRKNKNKKR